MYTNSGTTMSGIPVSDAKKITQVAQAIDELNTIVNALESMIPELEKKLEPVISFNEPINVGTSAVVTKSESKLVPLANELQLTTNRIRTIYVRVTNLFQRIEL